MAILSQELQVIIQSENKSRLSEERYVNKFILVRNCRRPNVERVEDHATDARFVSDQSPDEFIYLSSEGMHNPFKVLVMVEGSVEPDREAVAHSGVSYVEPAFPRFREYVVVGVEAPGLGDVVVD